MIKLEFSFMFNILSLESHTLITLIKPPSRSLHLGHVRIKPLKRLSELSHLLQKEQVPVITTNHNQSVTWWVGEWLGSVSLYAVTYS